MRIPYTPEGKDPVPAGARWGYYAGFPIPFDIDYQISVYTRMQEHQTLLTVELGKEARIPHRAGTLLIPEIGVEVSMDVQAGPTFSSRLDSDNKRIFETYYLVRVFSEMTPWEIERLTYPDHVAGTLRPLRDDKETEHFDFLYEGDED
ncbi:hypothetical protein [Nonomuraea sp. SYSU D8015]|uniref:hypothetical protein n=1 Tax=Nonomuraea sp. SYSU D8015 TaxID=2593644 RepID=UPI001660396C|nr:hypothetical protein [Nonomuraea sp. SYSU D8015]